jgi:hypothetical protein
MTRQRRQYIATLGVLSTAEASKVLVLFERDLFFGLSQIVRYPLKISEISISCLVSNGNALLISAPSLSSQFGGLKEIVPLRAQG